MKIPQTSGKKARIEIIPLIDVIFFLLATFVLFMLSMQKTLSIPLTLPVASNTQPPPDVDKPVALTITDQNLIYWNDEGPLDFELFLVRLGQYKRQDTNPRIMIRGNDHASYGTMVHVLDEIRKIGIDKVTVQTTIQPSR